LTSLMACHTLTPAFMPPPTPSWRMRCTGKPNNREWQHVREEAAARTASRPACSTASHQQQQGQSTR
jgi:hypothetical protein